MAKTATSGTTRKKKENNVQLIGMDIGKKPPQVPDLEEAVLGALMLEKEAMIDVQGILKPESFYKETHQKIYAAIQELANQHQPIDILTVTEELRKREQLDEVGGPYYLSQLTMRVGSAAHVEYHAKIIAQKYIQRELISISSEIQRDSFDENIGVDDLLDGAQQKIFELAEGNIRRETKHISNVVLEAYAELQKAQERDDGLSGVPSGYTAMDRMTLGWQASDMIIVAARPSMGKTAFVLTMARNMTVEHKVPVAFFSLEMPAVQLVKRLLTSESGLESEKIRGGKKMLPYEWTQLDTCIKNLEEAPLYIDDTPALSIFEFRAKARRLVMAHQIKLIIIDYLQLMSGPPEMKGLREQEVSAISRSLKAVAKELGVPIIALSQLNRSVETRGGNRRPQLSDLRESGAIEQDADLVLFIHRPEYYGITEDEQGNSLAGIAEIIIAKHRNGSIGDVQLRFRREQAKFMDLDDLDLMALSDEPKTIPSKMNNPASGIEYNKTFDLPPAPKSDVPF